jgi:hypothetical protein
MLEYNHQDDPMHESLMCNLRCEIVIPSSLGDFFYEKQSQAVVADDRRRYKRWNFRNVGALETPQTFDDLERLPCWQRIYVKDISLGGMAFLHSEQLYPLEQMRILLPERTLEPLLQGRKKRIAEVVRCRKWGDRCFEIGVKFLEKFRHDKPVVGHAQGEVS